MMFQSIVKRIESIPVQVRSEFRITANSRGEVVAVLVAKRSDERITALGADGSILIAVPAIKPGLLLGMSHVTLLSGHVVTAIRRFGRGAYAHPSEGTLLRSKIGPTGCQVSNVRDRPGRRSGSLLPTEIGKATTLAHRGGNVSMLTQGIATEIVLDDVVDVVRAAVSLGAAGRGGRLSRREAQLVKQARRRPPLSRSQRDMIEGQILRGEDPLGDALARIRTRAERREMGSFYTPSTIIAPMVSWALAHDPEIVVDPGCGSGRFAAAVARLSPDTQLLAIDKDAVATLVTRAVLEVLKPRRARVEHADFLALTTIHRTPGRRVAWLGNPPYVRHQLFSRTLKIRGVALAARAGHASLMTAGLHALFFTQTRLLAAPGDVGCYVTPSEWVDNKSGGIIRDLFMNGLGGESVLLLDPDIFAFAGVKTTAAITSFIVGSESEIRRLALGVSVESLADGLRTIGNDIANAALTTSRGWSRVVTNPRAMPDTGPTIGDLFHVHRGTATGANSFWVMTPEDAKARGLSKYAVPTVTRAEDIIVAGGTLKRRPDTKVMIFLPKALDRKADSAVDDFVRRGEKPDDTGLVVSQGSNAQKRSPWWSISVSKPAIAATYMARRPPTFAANPDRLGILNIAIGLEPKVTMDAATITMVVDALNTAAAGFEEYAVRYFGSLRKFEPKTIASLPLPKALHHLVKIESMLEARV